MLKIQISILSMALATSVMAAKPTPPNPMSGKSLAELEEVLKSEAPEMDRANAALALTELVSPPKEEGGPKKRKKGKGKDKNAPAWELKVPEGFFAACAVGLADKASAVRFYSGQALSVVGAEALPALTKAASSDSDDTRISAIHAIGMTAKSLSGKKGGPQADLTPVFGATVPVLRKALKDENHIVRETACAAFWRLGTAGAPAIDDLIARLDDDYFCVVNRAVQAVAAADPGGAKSVPALVDAIESKHDVREFIAKELGNMGQAAKSAVPALCKLVGEDKNSWHAALEGTKALLAIVTYKEKPEQDAVVEERKQALHAIGTTLTKQDAKFLQARIRNTIIDHAGYCPVGAESEPLVEWFEQLLREYARTEKGYFGPPLPKVVNFLAKVGENYKTEHLVALAKELKAADDTREVWLKEFEPILNLENK